MTVNQSGYNDGSEESSEGDNDEREPTKVRIGAQEQRCDSTSPRIAKGDRSISEEVTDAGWQRGRERARDYQHIPGR